MAEQQAAGLTAELNRDYFEAYVSAIDAIADESVVHVEDDGLKSAAVDPANVAIVETTLSDDAFRLFDQSEPDFGIGTYRTLPQIEGTDEDVVSLNYEAEFRKLKLGLGPYLYTHASISPDAIREEPEIPDLDDLEFEGQMQIGVLREAVEWFNSFAESVNVGYDAAYNQFFMEGNEERENGGGTDDGVFQLDRGELEAVRKPGDADSHFYLDYLSDIVGAVPDDTVVTLRLGQEMPLKLSYEIGGDDGEPVGQVTFMQAPRIQSD